MAEDFLDIMGRWIDKFLEFWWHTGPYTYKTISTAAKEFLFN